MQIFLGPSICLKILDESFKTILREPCQAKFACYSGNTAHPWPCFSGSTAILDCVLWKQSRDRKGAVCRMLKIAARARKETNR
jgi:hypothetical protein